MSAVTSLGRAARGLAPRLYSRSLASGRASLSHVRTPPLLQLRCASPQALPHLMGASRSCSTDAPSGDEPTAAPAAEAASDGSATSPKIAALVDQIASLSLLEASELTEALQVCKHAPH